MEDEFRNKIYAFILISVFGILILSAVVSLAGTYSKDYSDISSSSLSISKFNDSVSDITQQSKDFKTRFSEQSIWSAVAGVVVEGMFKITIDMFNIILAPFDLVTDIMIDIFQIPTFVTSTILALLILGILFSLFKLYKIGN